MAITFVGSASAEGDSVSGNYDITLPGGILPGDMVIVCTGMGSGGGTDLNAGVTTEGYAEEADLFATDTRAANLSINWKVMGETPDTTVTCIAPTTANQAGVSCCHVWRGVNKLIPMDVAVTTATGNNSPIPNSPAITPVTVGAIVLSLVGFIGRIATGGDEDTDATIPTGYENKIFDSRLNSDVGFHAGIASKAWSGSGAEDPGAWSDITITTPAQCAWCAATIALRPALSLPPIINTMQPFLVR